MEKGATTDQIVLSVGYDRVFPKDYQGPVERNHYGQLVPKSVHGSENIGRRTSSTRLVMDAALRLYDRIVDERLSVRRMYVVANHVLPGGGRPDAAEPDYEQMDLFTDYETVERERKAEEETLAKERRLQETLIDLKNRYGKNIILPGTSYQEGATGRERNGQVGGHKA